VVLSPHLDDAVLSLGAAIADATAAGADVSVVTAFAGDPSYVGEASPWDRRAGFSNPLEALAARRREDELACAFVGAKPVWLPFGYGGTPVDEPQLAQRLLAAVAGAETVLVPGWPLKNPEHAALTRTALRLLLGATGVGLYVEQPYVWWRSYTPPGVLPLLGEAGIGSVAWKPMSSSRAGRRAKQRALRAYRSQAKLLRGRPCSLPLGWRIALYERRAGGESVGWPGGPG
jgi:LmbE family N-acetylglucosaminyl deacetylase